MWLGAWRVGLGVQSGADKSINHEEHEGHEELVRVHWFWVAPSYPGIRPHDQPPPPFPPS